VELNSESNTLIHVWLPQDWFIYEEKTLPAEQTPTISPSKCLGALVNLTRIHPKAEPMINVRRILTGMNHLNHNKKC